MNLWIRSQDKKHLILPDHINVTNTQIYANTAVDYTTIGIYKTKERALEVLGEIQSLLMPKISVNPIVEEDNRPEYTYKHHECKGYTNTIGQLDTYVYEMPLN